MRIVKRYPDTITAHMARAILEAEGIDGFIADENLANADPPVIFASGGVRLMVPDEDLERAGQLLREAAQLAALSDDFDPGDGVESEVPTQNTKS